MIGNGEALAQGRFKVVGNKILDPSNNEFVAKGVNINGPNAVWPHDMSRDVDKIGNSCWNFNLVRVNSWLFSAGVRQYTSNNDIDKIVRTFTSRKIVVMFEAHDRTGGFYEGSDLTKLVDWYRTLAKKYRNNPYVWFDVMNEPGTHKYDATARNKWLAVHQAVIKAIRDDAQADNLIIVEGTAWGQDAGNWNSSSVPTGNSAILSDYASILNFGGKSYKNIVFSIHVYDQWTFGDARFADYVDRVLALNIPLLVGEFGVKNGNMDVTPAMYSMYNVVKPRKVGRVVWHWYHGGANNTLTNHLTTAPNGSTGAAIDSCTDPSNLTNLGREVWNDNHSQD
ncbi:cellulase family glycosylhydrolase [Chlorogloeopsis sp. ULAP01]|uniref:cellulase family glycosylhydrolase n=1 Tax=Chlorogloeopsis sp. ULAP01 TaxID=3056483 RepID=UPI0025AAC8A6|nr:cellulase family glycosylhydrolase [Chlorogloeopsis sp. ULAP01]MDM9383863.1 cellulase family glycosylhydrolase [Chlorogloeopsis sp. ULAP01]